MNDYLNISRMATVNLKFQFLMVERYFDSKNNYIKDAIRSSLDYYNDAQWKNNE